jgi:hypothetical protein
MDDLKVGKLYRLRFPGDRGPGNGSTDRPRALQRVSLTRGEFVLRSRWWVNSRGEPDNIYSPQLIVPFGEEARK